MSKLQRLLNIRSTSANALGELDTVTSQAQGYQVMVTAYQNIRKLIDPAEAKDPTDYENTTPGGLLEWLETVNTAAEAEILTIEAPLDLSDLHPSPLPDGFVLQDGSGSGI